MILTPHEDEQYAHMAVQAYVEQLGGLASDLEVKTSTADEYAFAQGTFTYAGENVYSFEARVLLLGDIWPKVGRLVVYLQVPLLGGLVSLEKTGEYVFQVAGDRSDPKIKAPWLSKEVSDRLRKKDGIE